MALPSLNPSACIGKPASIYALVDPRDQTAFYVGVTTKRLCNRLASHVNDARHLAMRSARCDRIRAIFDAGNRVEISELEVADPDCWVEAEQFWIEYLKSLGARLTNIGAGGPGALGSRQSASTQKRRSEAARGRNMTALRSAPVREKAASEMRHPIEVNGQSFPGIKRASDATGVPYSTLHHWLKTGKARRL